MSTPPSPASPTPPDAATPTPGIDFDSPWKEALEHFLPAVLVLLFPDVHAAIDWTHPIAFRDTELREVVRGAASGPTQVDKLVEVGLLEGESVWILLHIEVQSQADATFTARMNQYHARLVDRFECEVVSLAILGDESARWRPTRYTWGRLGCRQVFEFPTVKLHDFRARRAELAASDNPFVLVLEAHLGAQDTRGDAEARKGVKTGLLRRLLARGFSQQDILEIFRLINWLLELPPELEQAFRREAAEIEREGQVAYVTSFERLSRAEGHAEGREEGQVEGKRDALRRVVETKFGSVPEPWARRIAALDTVDALNALLVKVATASSLEEIGD